MSVQVWLLFCATEAVLSFTPGPAVLLVISESLSSGAQAGIAASLGILTANAAYFALSGTSLGAVLVASGKAFLVVKWAGSCYLVWLGGRMILGLQGTSERDGATADATPRSQRRSFSLAVLTQGANPKALVFFTAILPQFINPAGPLLRQILILGVSSIGIEFVVLSIYVLTCHKARTWVARRRFTDALERVGGAFLIAAGIGLALLGRS
jgi:homoserine/homoserine lactone efflux protein